MRSKPASKSVHPRPRGEHYNRAYDDHIRIGSSPPTRGTLWDVDHLLGLSTVHPRPRGEHEPSRSGASISVGSSPPTRGTHFRCFRFSVIHRFIPAHAGNTFFGSLFPKPLAVHPRPRGEHVLRVDVLVAEYRFIPAHAGNTSFRSRPSYYLTVHPRPRGEHGKERTEKTYNVGSSPPTRGTRQEPPTRPARKRFIPAHAGNTRIRRVTVVNISVHPRPRGEHTACRESILSTCGSSPPTRGTQPFYVVSRHWPRFIPAHAGNTLTSHFLNFPQAVHPRPRGEHQSPPHVIGMPIGSSPPTRGTPAPRTRAVHPTAVHPRPRGEHEYYKDRNPSHIGSSPPTRGTPISLRSG